MRNILATIAVLLSVCANAQYSEMLHAYITPTNKVVTSVPDWVKGAADYYTFGFRKDGSIDGFLSFAHGTNVTASGDFSFASGSTTISSAQSSHAEGNSTVASGFASHSEGCTTVARGNCSHAEGRYTTANGTYSHSSGVSSIASNDYSYVWSGVLPPTNPNVQQNKYGSNGEGTFNVNPIGGVNGFYIGTDNLTSIIQANAGIGFNEITHIITNDNTVTISPMDRKANYVVEKVKCGGIRFYTGIFKLVSSCYVIDSESDLFFRCSVEFNEQNATIDSYSADFQVSEDNVWMHTFRLTTKTDVPIYKEGTDEIVGNFPVFSQVLENEVLGNDTTMNHVVFSSSAFLETFWWKAKFTIDFTGDAITAEPSGYLDRTFEVGPDGLNITLPTQSDSVRQFSLTLMTDVESENNVVWNGGTIIEKFIGASKLAVGRTTWDVKEIAPNLFLVDRAPMNISSASSDVTIKGDNGNDYTLNIDENGVLEVRNK